MALTPEDGTGLAAADAFLSQAEADTHHDNYGNATAWDAVTDKDVLIRKATRYIDDNYNWIGQATTSDQALSWPRFDVVVDGFTIAANIVPTKVKQATAELALIMATTDPEAVLTSPGNILRKKEKFAVFEEDTTYTSAGSSQIPEFPVIDSLLSDFTTSDFGSDIIRA